MWSSVVHTIHYPPEKEAQVVRQVFNPKHDQTTPEDNTLDMLFQICVCWWNPLHIHECSTLMFLDVSECTCSVTSSGNEFQASHVVFYPCPTNLILMQYHIQLMLETLQGHVTFLIPEKQLAECPVVVVHK